MHKVYEQQLKRTEEAAKPCGEETTTREEE